MSICNFFGIYPDEIEKASDICDTVLRNAGFNLDEIDDIYDDMYDDIRQDIEETMGHDTITNHIIREMFSNVQYELEHKFKGLNISYYVNGWDSDMGINGELAQDFDFERMK